MRSSEDTIAKSLEGDYRSEHLFALRQSLTALVYQQLVLEVDREIELQLEELKTAATAEAEPELTEISLSRGDRCRRLPEMFRDLVTRLRKPLPLGTGALESAAVRNHGCLRRDQGYTAAMLVTESRMLQVSIFQTLHLHVEDTKRGVLLMHVMSIADEVDSQLAQSMKSYISEAKFDAEPIEA